MQISHILVVLSATAASLATPIVDAEQAEFEAIAAKYDIELTGAGASGFAIMSRSGENCYENGENWGNKRDYALDRAGRWCSGNGGAESYRQGQNKVGCYNLNSNKKVNFQIQNLQNRRVSLSSEACFRFLRGIINACSRGGRNGNGAWNWRADANAGSC
ncbi:hypothetical protein NM208_g6514 [Fusarium decemcellulare]|uniref:Uncharacterized protein n=1 Tax=Fusarium decemcellulare TaxID=57161 RepID=A0ACC1SCP3_9HYPO|nr:hypothetical protein NM208_g6514 [Fusarium decemcellulare]